MYGYHSSYSKDKYWWRCYDHLNRYCNRFLNCNVPYDSRIIVKVYDKEYDLGIWLHAQKNQFETLPGKQKAALQQMVDNNLLNIVTVRNNSIRRKSANIYFVENIVYRRTCSQNF